MAEIGALVAGLSIAAKIAENLYIFKRKAKNCSSVIEGLLQIVQNVERDRDLVRRTVADLNTRPDAATVGSDLLNALESLERPLNDLNQRLRDLNAREPTQLSRFVLSYKYEACRDELEVFQRQIDNGVRRDSAATYETYSSTSQSIGSNEHQPHSDTSTIYSEPPSKLFRETQRLKVKKVRELLDAGASPESRDPWGRTLIDVAVTLGGKHPSQDKMVEMLLSRGAKFTCTDPVAVKLYKEIKSTINLTNQRRRIAMG